MITKTITAKNDSGELKPRTLYFNLTKAEALEINMMENLEAVGESNDPRKIIPVFKRIVRAAYGVKLPSNKFTKDDYETADFLASDYYSELFLELLNAGEQAVAEFFRSILNFDAKDLDKPAQAAPTRPAPQDYKPSAKEVAAAAKAEKENIVVEERSQMPSERYRTPAPAGVSTDFESSPEFKEWQRRKELEHQLQNGAQGEGYVDVAPAAQQIEVHPAEDAPGPFQNYDPNKAANSPFQQGS